MRNYPNLLNWWGTSILDLAMRFMVRAPQGMMAVLFLLIGFASKSTKAEPFQGAATATMTEGITSAQLRQQALLQARRVALGAALRSIRLPTNSERYEQVRSQMETWTGSYRVLSSETKGQEFNVDVEVDIDLPRLRKWIWKRPESDRSRGFSLGKVSWSENCGSSFAPPDKSSIELPLQAYGILDDHSTEQLSLEITCKSLGSVSFSYLQAVQVEVLGQTQPGGLALRAQSFGFANVPADAITVALSRAFDSFALQLLGELGTSIDIRLVAAWPAFRIRRLEQALRETVVGIDKAGLAAILGDGDVIIRVSGSLTSQELAEKLENLRFSEFSIYEVQVESSRRVTISLQSFDSEVQLE